MYSIFPCCTWSNIGNLEVSSNIGPCRPDEAKWKFSFIVTICHGTTYLLWTAKYIYAEICGVLCVTLVITMQSYLIIIQSYCNNNIINCDIDV